MTKYTEREVQIERDHLLLDCGFVHSSPVIKMLTQLASMLADAEKREPMTPRELAKRIERGEKWKLADSHPAAHVPECQHEWVSGDNQYVKNAEVCLKCNTIRATQESGR